MKIRPRFQLTQLTTANPLPYTYALLADHAGRNSGKARQMGEAMSYTVSRLDWTDASLGVIATPRGQLALRASFGSGLATRDGDPPGRVWAVCDRGPNLKVTIAIERYGLDVLTPLADVSGAKIMPDPTIGPAIAELQIDDDTVTLLRTIRLVDEIGSPVMGLPDASSEHVVLEPVFDIQGKPIGPSCLGLDSEGIVALASGGFWIGDEFAPALVRVDDKGQIVQRLVPQQIDHGGGEEVHAGLPAIAARRQINRGFEALSLSGDERSLFLAFQSPLAHPDEDAHRRARHVRLWRLDTGTGFVTEQYLYPLDRPRTFLRDRMLGPFGREDIKVSEIAWLPGNGLVVLERGSATTKLYRVDLDTQSVLQPEHLDIRTRPTIEEMSAANDMELPVLAKRLLFSSDDIPEISADLEGMTFLSPTELLLVNDNDFGVEDGETSFWRIRFDKPLWS